MKNLCIIVMFFVAFATSAQTAQSQKAPLAKGAIIRTLEIETNGHSDFPLILQMKNGDYLITHSDECTFFLSPNGKIKKYLSPDEFRALGESYKEATVVDECTDPVWSNYYLYPEKAKKTRLSYSFEDRKNASDKTTKVVLRIVVRNI